MKIETDTVTLPSYWASALINGDYSGLNDNESSRCDAAVDELARGGWEIIDVIENSERFTWDYRLYDPLQDASGDDVCDYTILRNPR